MTAQIVDERKDLLRRSLDARRALDAERARLGRGEADKAGDQNDNHDDDYGNYLVHGDLSYTNVAGE
jgi:hypothetical protein